ncbi:MAG: shikimate dehydrogenase [Acidimicrobiales bacterium]
MTAPGSAPRRSPHWPTARSTVVATIGDPIAHSLSPLLHQAAFDALGLDWVSVAFRVPQGKTADALSAMRALGIAGLSVTMPHKAEAALLVDELTPLAERLGAVNCVVNRDGRLLGESTDGAGLVRALRRGAGFDPSGRRCVVIGAGGAARAAVVALAEAGAAEVVVVNRTRAHADAAAALAGPLGGVGGPDAVGSADLVVQATPVGMVGAARDGSPGGPPDYARFFHPGQVVMDLVYVPALTPVLLAAAERGAGTLGGLGMLVHQAAIAIEHWTGRPGPVEQMWSVATGALQD